MHLLLHRPVPNRQALVLVWGPGVRDSWPRSFVAKLLYPDSKISITSKPCVICGEEFLPQREPRNCYEKQDQWFNWEKRKKLNEGWKLLVLNRGKSISILPNLKFGILFTIQIWWPKKKWRKRNLGSLINFYLKCVFSLKYLLLDSIRLSQMWLCLVLLKAFSLLVFQYNFISSLKSSYFLKICHEKRLDKIQATVGMFKNTPTVTEIGEGNGTFIFWS